MLSNIKSKFESINFKKSAIMSVPVILASASFASATGGVSTSITTALTAVKADALATISAVAPIGISIMGVFLVWRYGIRFFKSISK